MAVSCLEVPVGQAAGALGLMTVDSDSKVMGFGEKPKTRHPPRKMTS